MSGMSAVVKGHWQQPQQQKCPKSRSSIEEHPMLHNPCNFHEALLLVSACANERQLGQGTVHSEGDRIASFRIQAVLGFKA